MEYLAELEDVVLGFSVRPFLLQKPGPQGATAFIDCLSGKKLYKIQKESGKILFEKEIFEKTGLARILNADSGQIIISDFCTLYVFDGNDYKLIGRWQIGTDLSSDICGLAVDDRTIFCSIRNGKLVTVDRKNFEMKEYSVCDSSMWSLNLYDNYLLCGTVDGQLLFLDRKTMRVTQKLSLSKQNVRSLFVDENTIYAASQDRKISVIDLEEKEIIRVQKSAHKKMFNCAGIYNNMLVTVSFPCSEIALWDKETLEKKREIHVPLKLSGCTHIEGNKLYISSRNICGIGLLNLDN